MFKFVLTKKGLIHPIVKKKGKYYIMPSGNKIAISEVVKVAKSTKELIK